MSEHRSIKQIPIVPLDKQRSSEISFIPKSDFMCLMTGSISKGKTTLLINLLTNQDALAMRFNRIIIFSPTAALDSKWTKLYNHIIIKSNKPLLKEILKRKRKSKNRILDNVNDNIDNEILNIYENRAIDESDFISEWPISYLEDIINEQDSTIKKYGKELANKILIILDDYASESKLWNNHKFTKMVFTSRHYKISSIITTQAYYNIPKKIRLNCAFKILFNISNKKELQMIYNENNCNFSWEEWNELYEDIMSEYDFNFVSINLYNPNGYQFSKCFLEFIN